MTALDVNPLLKGSLDSALISLCDRVEALAPGSIAGLTICNPPLTRLERAIFPRLPRYAAEIVEIPLSPNNFGSCVRAVACGEIITCPDIANEQRFDPAWRNMNSSAWPAGTAVATGLSPRPQAVRHIRACLSGATQ